MNDRAQAVSHLRTACVPHPAKDDAALTVDWQSAKAAIGGPLVPNAGTPAIQPIAINHPYLVQLMNDPWTGAMIAQGYPGFTFQMVEIDALFAFQFVVDAVRSASHCGNLSNPPVADELFPICLPIGQPAQPYQFSLQGQSLVVKAKGLNLRLYPLNVNQSPAGLGLGVTLAFGPQFVYVTRFQNKMYLSNGFHRAYGIRQAGHTHMPCIFRDVANPLDVGMLDNMTFTPAEFQTANPPTLAHFTQGRALAVDLRETSRVLTVSWSEHAIADE